MLRPSLVKITGYSGVEGVIGASKYVNVVVFHGSLKFWIGWGILLRRSSTTLRLTYSTTLRLTYSTALRLT